MSRYVVLNRGEMWCVVSFPGFETAKAFYTRQTAEIWAQAYNHRKEK